MNGVDQSSIIHDRNERSVKFVLFGLVSGRLNVQGPVAGLKIPTRHSTPLCLNKNVPLNPTDFQNSLLCPIYTCEFKKNKILKFYGFSGFAPWLPTRDSTHGPRWGSATAARYEPAFPRLHLQWCSYLQTLAMRHLETLSTAMDKCPLVRLVTNSVLVVVFHGKSSYGKMSLTFESWKKTGYFRFNITLIAYCFKYVTSQWWPWRRPKHYGFFVLTK